MNNQNNNNDRIVLTNGIVVDDARARLVLTHAAESWKQKSGAFAGLEQVESRMRPHSYCGPGSADGERMKAVYVFLQGFSQRSGKSAEFILKKLHGWFMANPSLLDPRNGLEETEDFYTFVRDVDPSSRESTNYREIGWWQKVMRVLREQYDGDPRQLFYNLRLDSEIPFIDELLRADMEDEEQIFALRKRLITNLIDFKGVKLKIASLIVIFFQEEKWDQNQEFWNRLHRIPFIPFDLHHIRLTWMTEIVPPNACITQGAQNGNRDIVAEVLSEYFSRLCYELKLSHSAVAQAFFNTGAFIHAQWNRNKRDQHAQYAVCEQCPFDTFCRRTVQPNSALSTKKSRRSLVNRQLTNAKRVEEFKTGNLDSGTPVQLFLGGELQPNIQQLVAMKESIGSETHDRGAICTDVKPRKPRLYDGDLFHEIYVSDSDSQSKF